VHALSDVSFSAPHHERLLSLLLCADEAAALNACLAIELKE
jgi:hypothetical protein